jgi:hypothetical protein
MLTSKVQLTKTQLPAALQSSQPSFAGATKATANQFINGGLHCVGLRFCRPQRRRNSVTQLGNRRAGNQRQGALCISQLVGCFPHPVGNARNPRRPVGGRLLHTVRKPAGFAGERAPAAGAGHFHRPLRNPPQAFRLLRNAARTLRTFGLWARASGACVGVGAQRKMALFCRISPTHFCGGGRAQLSQHVAHVTGHERHATGSAHTVEKHGLFGP